MKRIAFGFLCFVASMQMWSQERTGTISVKVIDQLGNPLTGAIVKLDPPPGRMLLYASPSCKTNASGSCTQNILEMDTYFVRVKKPTDGYPDMSFNFYSHQSKEIIVKLSRRRPDSNVLFALGPKAATLKLKVVDDATDVPIDNPTIILRDATDPKDFVGGGLDADLSVLIPPDEGIQVEVAANGYELWKLSEHPGLTRGEALHLRVAERRELTIRMKHQ